MSEHAHGMSGLCTMHRTSCETVGASFKAVGDNFNKLQNHHAHFAAVGQPQPTLVMSGLPSVAAVGPVSKLSGPLRNRPSHLKSVRRL